jgi:energy-coupling factor transporter ATP-binding protein EcfA2
MQPDILVVDEALAVGDVYFRHRCMRKIHELRERGVTIVYVTHEVGEIKELGHRVLWLEHGRVRELGEVGGIANRYLVSLLDKDVEHWKHRQSSVLQQPRTIDPPPEVIAGIPSDAPRYGDGRAELLGVEVADRDGQPLESIRTPAEIVVRMSVRACEAIERPIAGVLIRTDQGLDVSGSNTARQNIPVTPMMPGEIRTFDFHFRLPELAPAFYTFTCGLADGDLVQYRMCDLAERAAHLRVLAGEKRVTGYLHLPCVVNARAHTR